jgi:hypothetical protein
MSEYGAATFRQLLRDEVSPTTDNLKMNGLYGILQYHPV